MFLPRLADNFDAMGDGTVHLHCTDVDGEWLLTRRDGEVDRDRGAREGRRRRRAARASDLLLFLWGRVPADSLEVFGDADLLARFRQAIRV